MSSFRPREFRSYSIVEFLAQASDATASQEIYSLTEGKDQIQVQTDSFNIVLSKNISRNVRLSLRLALEMSKERKVVYVNTYAGSELLTQSLAQAVAKIAEASGDTTEQPSSMRELLAKYPNFRMVDSPVGDWDGMRVAREIKSMEAEVLIINSFEYAPLVRYQKEKVAIDLLQIQQLTGMSIVIFSHETNTSIDVYMPGRGPLGLLSAYASTVSRLGEEWLVALEKEQQKKEKIFRAIDRRKAAEGQKQANSATIHEEKTQQTDGGLVWNWSLAEPKSPEGGRQLPQGERLQASTAEVYMI